MEKSLVTKDELIDFFESEDWYVCDEDESEDSEKICLSLEFVGEVGESYSFGLDCERNTNALHHALYKQFTRFSVDECVWNWLNEGRAEVGTLVDDARKIEGEIKKLADNFQSTTKD